MALIELRGVTKIYSKGGRDFAPLKDVDIDIEKGEFVALMGPSGSGKTTLLNIISGIDKPTRGSVKVGGIEVPALSRSKAAEWRSRAIGYIFQRYNLVPVLTAFENVELPLLLHKMSSADRAKRVTLALQAAGIAHRANHTPTELSGGEEQRVSIARAIVADPQIIVADEPTGDLDRDSATAILALLTRLHREFGKTLLMVTHDPKAAEIAQRTIRLQKGTFLTPEPGAPVPAAVASGSGSQPPAPAPSPAGAQT